jgi:predicted PurR-regulated permease PerM
MKKLLAILTIVLFVGQTWAQSTEYLQQKDFKVEKQKIYEGINASKRQVNDLKKIDLKMQQSIDSLNRKLGYSDGKQGMVADSLSKTSTKLNALQEKVDSQKFLSKGVRILIIVVLLVLFAILFIMLYLVKKKADENRQALDELERTTNERLDVEMKHFKAEIQSSKEHIASLSNEMTQRISAGLSTMESKSQQLEQQLKDDLARIGGRVDIIGPEISKVREEQSNGLKALEDKLGAVKRELEQKNQALMAQAAKLEEEIRLFKEKH